MKQEPILIVGGGVAGICIAKHLSMENIPFRIVDSGQNHSSAVAAGMINPLVFRRMTKSWRVDEFLPYLTSFYKNLEREAETTFFHAIPIRRLFSSEQELNFWRQKQEKEDFRAYMTPLDSECLAYSLIPNSFGSGIVKGSGWLDTKVFMRAAHSVLRRFGDITIEPFDFNDLDPVTGNYQGKIYSKVIFCEGTGVNYNPYFKWLPIHATKGETLTILSDFLPTSESINRKCFVLPLGDQKFKVGATYVWQTSTTDITEAGRTELEEKLKYIHTGSYEIIQQEAGIRPTTPDRRPILGKHPELERLFVFNGLGTKGYMIAPLLAKEFVAFLLDKVPLSEEVSLERF